MNKTEKFKIVGYSLITAVPVILTMVTCNQYTDNPSTLFITFFVLWIFLSFTTNIICVASPWKIKLKTKRKSPIYKVEKLDEHNVYRFLKYELYYDTVDSLSVIFSLPFGYLFKIPTYERVYDELFTVKIKDIKDLEQFIENSIAAKRKLEEKELEPLDNLNKEFYDNYFE